MVRLSSPLRRFYQKFYKKVIISWGALLCLDKLGKVRILCFKMSLFENSVIAQFILPLGWGGVYWANEPDKSGHYRNA